MSIISPEKGDIWKELDPRVEYQRYVRVTDVRAGDSVRIYKVMETSDGVWEACRRAPERWAQIKRFNGKRGGYELYRRASALKQPAETACDAGVAHPGCRYLCPTGGACNKCGYVDQPKSETNGNQS